MPELPEVETVRRQLEETVVGRTISQTQVFFPKITRDDNDFARFLVGKSFTRIDRIGKLLIFETTDRESYLLAHLKMTGKFLFRQEGAGYDKHVHLVITFEDGSELLFRDVRKFGYVIRANKEEVVKARSKYGIEPLTPDYVLENFKKIFLGRKTNIKALLLNQSLIAGLGNIYVDEILFRARVHPSRRANSVTSKEKELLFLSSQEVITGAINKGGTTFIDFAHTDGQSGSYVDDLQVFSREGKPCFRCNALIKKVRVAGRGTHFCPNCQT